MMEEESEKIVYEFGPFVFDPLERLLWRGGQVVDLDKKTFALLHLFVEHPGHLFSKNELIEKVWDRKFGAEGSLSNTISVLRSKLGDDKKTYIVTEINEGYRFVCAVEIRLLPIDTQPGSSLPEPPTRLIGRSREIAEIERLAESSSVITVVGGAGIGKTSLAIKAASQLSARYTTIQFVPLADIMDARLIIDEIGSVLGIDRSNPELREAVVRELSRQPFLLVLDNFEQVVESGAIIVKELVQSVRGLTCLVTSRRRLKIAEESWFELSPLDVPGESIRADQLREVESVQLFLERARSANPGFELSEKTTVEVAAICRWLDGIPLAIELVAQRMDEFSPVEILENLERVLELLVSEQRDAIPRHHSLQAAIEWSYQLLAPDLQQLFARSSVFLGGFTIKSAEMVCREPEARNALNRLVDHSLLKRELVGNNRRFRMIEVYREFGDKKLSQEERERTAQTHADYFFDMAENASQKLFGPEQKAWLDRLEAERDNLRAALDYCEKTDSAASRELELAVSLSGFWYMRGYWTEGITRLKSALARQPLRATSLKAKGLAWLGWLLYGQDDYEDAKQTLLESVAIGREIDDKEGLAFSLFCLGFLVEAQGSYDEAKSLLRESLQLSQDVNSQWLTGEAFYGLGIVAEAEGDYLSAKDFLLKSLLVSERTQNIRRMAGAMDNLGAVLGMLGDYSQARSFHEKSLDLRQSLGHKNGIAYSYFYLGLLEEKEGQHQIACKFFHRSLALRQELGDRAGVARALEGIGRMAVGLGKGEEAARILGAAEAIRLAIAAPVSPAEHKLYGQILLSVKERFQTEWREGTRWLLDESVAYALKFNSVVADCPISQSI